MDLFLIAKLELHLVIDSFGLYRVAHLKVARSLDRLWLT